MIQELMKSSNPILILFKKGNDRLLPTDEYYNYQFYLNNTGQTLFDGYTGTDDARYYAPEAWEISIGTSDKTVAIIDDGVVAHPDLPIDNLDIHPNCNFAYEYTKYKSDNCKLIYTHIRIWISSIHMEFLVQDWSLPNTTALVLQWIAPKCKIMPL
jgi:hypothetical protein